MAINFRHSNLVLPYLQKLEVCFADALILTLKSLLEELLTEIISGNLFKYHKVALFLFLPTKTLLQFDKKEECREAMTPETTASVDNPFVDFIEPRKDDNGVHKIEIENYLNTNVLQRRIRKPPMLELFSIAL